MGLHLGVHQGVSFEFDHLVCFLSCGFLFLTGFWGFSLFRHFSIRRYQLWPWSLGVFSFPMASFSSLVFKDFLSSAACPAGGIGFRGASKVYFWPWCLGVFPFSINYCSSLEFGGFLSYDACSLGGIRSGGLLQIFGLCSLSNFHPLWVVGLGESFFLVPHPSLFPYLINLMRRRTHKYLYLLWGWRYCWWCLFCIRRWFLWPWWRL